jgi:hypothetical protein
MEGTEAAICPGAWVETVVWWVSFAGITGDGNGCLEGLYISCYQKAA